MTEDRKRSSRAPKASEVTETDLAQRKMGDNKLQGEDQASVHNQRHDVPERKQEPDDVIDSLEKLDKNERARRDLGKGNRSGHTGR